MSFEYNLYKKEPSHRIRNFFKGVLKIFIVIIIIIIITIIGIFCAEIIENTSPNINSIIF